MSSNIVLSDLEEGQLEPYVLSPTQSNPGLSTSPTPRVGVELSGRGLV